MQTPRIVGVQGLAGRAKPRLDVPGRSGRAGPSGLAGHRHSWHSWRWPRSASKRWQSQPAEAKAEMVGRSRAWDPGQPMVQVAGKKWSLRAKL